MVRPDRQALAREFGATDIVEERGDQGVAAVKELTSGLGAHSVIEAVSTQESMMQAIRSTRPGGHLGYVGVAHDVQWDRKINPGSVFDLRWRTPPTGTGHARAHGRLDARVR